jgi:hypothetical protein
MFVDVLHDAWQMQWREDKHGVCTQQQGDNKRAECRIHVSIWACTHALARSLNVIDAGYATMYICISEAESQYKVQSWACACAIYTNDAHIQRTQSK